MSNIIINHAGERGDKKVAPEREGDRDLPLRERGQEIGTGGRWGNKLAPETELARD